MMMMMMIVGLPHPIDYALAAIGIKPTVRLLLDVLRRYIPG